MTPAEQEGFIESHETITDPEDIEEVAECFRIVRNFQDCSPRSILRKLQEQFPNKSADELRSLLSRVQEELQ